MKYLFTLLVYFAFAGITIAQTSGDLKNRTTIRNSDWIQNLTSGNTENSLYNESSVLPIPPGKSFDLRNDAVSTSESFDTQIIVLDAFSTDAVTVLHFKNQGLIVLAHISVGTYQDWLPDANIFKNPDGTFIYPDLMGNNVDNWPGEKWIDIRQINNLTEVLSLRFDMIRDKGFDGIAPDNLDGYTQTTGFALTPVDAIAYSIWLVDMAHIRDLSIGQRNTLELIPELVDDFDWILVEQAYEMHEYLSTQPYLSNNKAVFAVEYLENISETDFTSNFCTEANNLGISAVLKDFEWSAFAVFCSDPSYILQGPQQNKAEVVVYPNPATNHLNIDIYSKTTEKIHYCLFDIMGNTVLYGNYEIVQGYNLLNISFEKFNLNNGLYILQIKGKHCKFPLNKIVKN